MLAFRGYGAAVLLSTDSNHLRVPGADAPSFVMTDVKALSMASYVQSPPALMANSGPVKHYLFLPNAMF